MGELVFFSPPSGTAEASIDIGAKTVIETNRLTALSEIARIVARLNNADLNEPSSAARGLVITGQEIIRRLANFDITTDTTLEALQRRAAEMLHLKRLSAEWQHRVVTYYKLLG